MMSSLLTAFWSRAELVANGLLLLHLLAAAAVGIVVGYERTFHGRAAGMRTYALVCMSSALLTAICASPQEWFGGLNPAMAATDPTRVIQGIVTGIGFLGAGVIIKEGFTIRGLSTSASIWTTSALGITIGIGFYGAAIAGAVLTVLAMSVLSQLEIKLPHQKQKHLSLVYSTESAPTRDVVVAMMADYGFVVRDCAYHFDKARGRLEFGLVLQAINTPRTDELARALIAKPELIEFRLMNARD